MNTEPDAQRRQEGPYVVIECPEKIPCDPCVGACPQGAISIPGSLIELPQVDYEKCTGCLMCIPRCPGLAIFVIDETPEDHAIIYIPYEFIPLPKKGDKAKGLDRHGKERCDVVITKVIAAKKFDHCAVIGFMAPKNLINDVRFLKLTANPDPR
ncbi:4Fe-4S binding protein [candidate division WOR-3 bacterium]|nr:4Fe-4S binding protein [candidate division WOR-3 bacterium]